MIKEKTITEIQKLSKESGCDIDIQISLDGSCAETHDRMRGKTGNFKSVCKTIEKLVGLGYPPRINMTITNENIDDVINTYELVNRLSAKAFSFRAAICHGRSQDEIDKDKSRNILVHLLKNKQGHVRAFSQDPLHVPLQLEKLGITQSDLTSGSVWGGCSAGIASIYIDHTGNICPCPYLSTIVLGNIKNDKVSSVWGKSKELNVLRNRNSLTGKCGDCQFKHVCGGCRANALGRGLDLMDTDPMCVHNS